MVSNNTTFRPTYLYNEYKYIVPPRCTALVRRMLHVQSVDVDPFPEGTVQSIYYDTIDRTCLGQCKDGQARKIKFRIRRYDDQDAGQLQVKLKDGFAVAKLKSAIAFPRKPPMEWPESDRTAAGGVDGIGTLGLAASNLRPVIDIRYRRERFRFRDYRVTFDSEITASPCDGLVYPRTTAASLDFAVLEVKTPESIPLLPPGVRGLVSFGSLSKYGVLMQSVLGEVDVLCKHQPY